MWTITSYPNIFCQLLKSYVENAYVAFFIVFDQGKMKTIKTVPYVITYIMSVLRWGRENVPGWEQAVVCSPDEGGASHLTLLCPWDRGRIYTEEKSKVFAAVWGTAFIQFLAVLAILHQDDMK